MRGLPLLCGAALAAASCGAPGHLAGDAGIPRGYVCHRGTPQIDGRLDEAEWAAAPWTAEFVDIQGGAMPAPRFATRARMLWDDEYLYVGAWMDEPHVWGTLTEHDSVIFHDNDFEVFLDPDGDTHQYYEFEINALNTGWDLRLVKPYLDGGPALDEWEIPGLRTAVWIDGTLNDPADTDHGWSVEIALPWRVLAEFANRPAPPQDGDQWRINFSRVEWQHEVVDGAYRKVPDTPEDNWVWSPQGRINMHLPEQWGYLQFSTAAPGAAAFRPDPELPARRELIRVYEAQHAFHEAQGRWARSLDELGLASPAALTPQPDGWNARLDGVWIRQDRRIWSLDGQDPEPWWPAGVAAALDRCTPERRAVWSELLLATPAEQRRGAAFLVEHMPALDLAGLDPAVVRESLEYGYRVRAEMPWCATLPEEVFLNEVLPYAHVSERRETWRADFHARFAPLVADCDSAAAAAQRLNETIFGELGVKYSTKRRRADQSPSESIEQGLASCTGLSILLADACRAVGVPARLAGIPRWANKPGNHTWVEVWDGGWHFTGAAEPDARGLDHAWFEGDARQALRDSRMSSIYAVSYARTGLELPMVWSEADWQVQAVNVTDRYAPREGGGLPADRSRLMIDVRDERSGERVAAELIVADEADREIRFEGTTKDEGADTNDHLSFEVPRGRSWRITARWSGHELELVHPGKDAPEELVTISLPIAEDAAGPAAALAEAAAAWFAAPAAERDAVGFSPEIAAWMARDEAAAEKARALVWQAYLEAPLHAEERAELEARRVAAGGYESPYTLKQVGEKPAGGWPLFIAMHGGGGVPKEFNDSQWEHMQIYYKDHPEAGGYLYLALRAPTDEWNGFYTDYMYPLVERLVRTLLACGEVDPGKVFLMGYSHGGYGAFAIGPKMPDLFAAVHASAAAPTPGQTTARTLRNTVFTFMVGEKDTAYGRAERCQEFAAEVAALQEAHPGAYPVTFEWQPGYGHGGLPDRDKIPSMYPNVRDAAPAALDWLMTDGVVRHHFWLSVDAPAAGNEVTAEVEDNHLRLAAEGVDEVRVRLDHRLVDFGRPLKISAGGAEREVELAPDPAVLCRTILERGDPHLAASVELRIGTAG